MSSRVKVNVDGPTWWALGRLAEKRGIRVDDLLAEIALTGKAARPNGAVVPPTTRQLVAHLTDQGLSAARIAERLGVQRQTVYYHQKRFGQSPRRRSKGHTA